MLERLAPKFCAFAISALISPRPRLAPKSLALHPHLALRAEILRLLLKICTSRANLGLPSILRLPPKSCAFQINYAPFLKSCASRPNIAPCPQILHLVPNFCASLPNSCASRPSLRFVPEYLPKYCALPPNLAPCAQFLHLLPQILRLAPKFVHHAQILCLAPKCCVARPNLPPPGPSCPNLAPRSHASCPNFAPVAKITSLRPNISPSAPLLRLVPISCLLLTSRVPVQI